MKAQSSTRIIHSVRSNAGGRGMRTSMDCGARVPVADGHTPSHTDTHPDTLVRRLDGNETILAVATAAERRVFTIFKWSGVAMGVLVLLTLFLPALMLGVLLMLPIVTVYGSKWKTTREGIARRLERAATRADAFARRDLGRDRR